MRKKGIPVLILLLLGMTILTAQQNDEQLLQQAGHYFEQGDYTQARLAYRQHQMEFPQSPQADFVAFRLARATSKDRALPREQRFAEAVRLYDLAITLHEDSPLAPEALYDMAVSYLNLGFVQDAIIQLRRSRDNYPDAANRRETWLLLADSYYFLDDTRQAALFYRGFLDAFPIDQERKHILSKLAECYFANGTFRSAEQIFDELEKTFPGTIAASVDLMYLQASTNFELGRYERAEQLFSELQSKDEAEDLLPFIQYNLARISEKKARALEADDKKRHLREAMGLYHEVYQEYAEEGLQVSAMLEMVRLADELEVSVISEYGLPSATILLNDLYSRILDPDTKALVLARLAQHHRRNGRPVLALDNYFQMTELYADTEIAGQTLTEFHKFLRQLMNNALEINDYDQYLNLFLRYGVRLDVTDDEQFNIAIAYMRVGLFDDAETLFAQMLAKGLDEDKTRQIETERLRYYHNRKQYQLAKRQLEKVLRMNPEPLERELALFVEQEIYFAGENLEALQAIYLDEKEKIDTPLLHISMLQKLGRLQFLNTNYDLSRRYIEEIFGTYDLNNLDKPELFPIVKAAWLIRADLFYVYGEFARAADAYQRYLFYASVHDTTAWSLSQLAESLIKIDRREFANEVLQCFMQQYSDHYLAESVQLRLKELEK